MMIDRDEDKLFEDLLADYTAPIADDGFSRAVLARIHRPQALAKLRRTWMLCASLIGGAIAATQLPALLSMLQDTLAASQIESLPTPDFSMVSPYSWAAGVMALCIVLLSLYYVLAGQEQL